MLAANGVDGVERTFSFETLSKFLLAPHLHRFVRRLSLVQVSAFRDQPPPEWRAAKRHGGEVQPTAGQRHLPDR